MSSSGRADRRSDGERSRIADEARKKRVLFACTHNSARSQMAEGLLRARYGAIYEAASAGTEPTRVHPLAVQVMGEIGIDVSNHVSRNVEEFLGQAFDLVVAVCDHAKEVCPFFPGAQQYVHASFPDPSQGTDAAAQLLAFRGVRNRIASWIDTYLNSRNQTVRPIAFLA